MIGKDFIENTKYQYIKSTGHLENKMPPQLQLPYSIEAEIIDLPDPDSPVIHTCGRHFKAPQRRDSMSQPQSNGADAGRTHRNIFAVFNIFLPSSMLRILFVSTLNFFETS